MNRAKARIAPNDAPATQSGHGAGGWALEIEPIAPRKRDDLMGWTASTDTRTQIRLVFPTRDEAIRYAERRGLDYDADPEPAATTTPKPRLYQDNFAANRARPWTH